MLRDTLFCFSVTDFWVFYILEKRTMLYLFKDSLRNEVMIPRVLSVLPSGDYSLNFRNNANREMSSAAKADFNYDFSLDFSQGLAVEDSALYHRATFSWPSTPQSGEYTYWLTKGDVVVAMGLLIITASRKVEEYDNLMTYEQYE